MLSRVGNVAYSACARAGEGADDGVETDEGGDDAARVQGGVIGDVIEGAAENEVVCCGVDGSKEGV